MRQVIRCSDVRDRASFGKREVRKMLRCPTNFVAGPGRFFRLMAECRSHGFRGSRTKPKLAWDEQRQTSS